MGSVTEKEYRVGYVRALILHPCCRSPSLSGVKSIEFTLIFGGFLTRQEQGHVCRRGSIFVYELSLARCRIVLDML